MEGMTENAQELTNKTLAFVDTIDSLESERKKSRTEDTKSEASVSFISYHLATYFYIGL